MSRSYTSHSAIGSPPTMASSRYGSSDPRFTCPYCQRVDANSGPSRRKARETVDSLHPYSLAICSRDHPYAISWDSSLRSR
jgi:hypothetical protein